MGQNMGLANLNWSSTRMLSNCDVALHGFVPPAIRVEPHMYGSSSTVSVLKTASPNPPQSTAIFILWYAYRFESSRRAGPRRPSRPMSPLSVVACRCRCYSLKGSRLVQNAPSLDPARRGARMWIFVWPYSVPSYGH